MYLVVFLYSSRASRTRTSELVEKCSNCGTGKIDLLFEYLARYGRDTWTQKRDTVGTHEVKSRFMHEIIVRALDEMQLLGPQIENRLEKLIRV